MTYQMHFDPRHSFHLFTTFPSTEPFPFQQGDHLWLQVILIPHPMQAWVHEELSASSLWYASVRPAGQPKPMERFEGTILIELARLEAPSQSWQLPWQVDTDEVLITMVDEPADFPHLAQFEYGTAIPARIVLEVTKVTGLEIIPDSRERGWQIILSPLGERQNNLISSEVEILTNE